MKRSGKKREGKGRKGERRERKIEKRRGEEKIGDKCSEKKRRETDESRELGYTANRELLCHMQE
jgi:hypothetical protein